MRNISIVAAFALLVATASAWSARAQSSLPDHNLMFNPNTVRQGTTPPAAKQRPAKPATTATKTDATKRTARPAASRPAAAPQNPPPRLTVNPPPDPPPPMLGRIPFESGTLGFTTDTKYKTFEFNDGRRTPGFENIQRKDPAYLGFSLSVPTDRPSTLPLPFLSRPD